MSAAWQATLAWALIGEQVDLAEPGRPDPDLLVVDLATEGWPAQRIAEHAASVTAAGQPWPHQPPAALRAGCGAAQLAAALASVRQLLGLDGLIAQPPSLRRRLNAEERRLLLEVPPHHGS